MDTRCHLGAPKLRTGDHALALENLRKNAIAGLPADPTLDLPKDFLYLTMTEFLDFSVERPDGRHRSAQATQGSPQVCWPPPTDGQRSTRAARAARTFSGDEGHSAKEGGAEEGCAHHAGGAADPRDGRDRGGCRGRRGRGRRTDGVADGHAAGASACAISASGPPGVSRHASRRGAGDSTVVGWGGTAAARGGRAALPGEHRALRARAVHELTDRVRGPTPGRADAGDLALHQQRRQELREHGTTEGGREHRARHSSRRRREGSGLRAA
mmetsp:Transcript_87340/g.224963  ORF Transcript_87340/g.224963 Transcript_87340/m.224963 type:complete len:270 (-) Transcript_87340:8-817(-)